ncbi:unnamed protein product [Prorocentrum cordatum]|uniref:EF-hand domain-containing protein n=1 Tax=Prorocentrum cordatum TaxID=2364126 RepID=A0ABN9TRG9_9DINO|nr:unnamed protein product [Polarella glacialis]
MRIAFPSAFTPPSPCGQARAFCSMQLATIRMGTTATRLVPVRPHRVLSASISIRCPRLHQRLHQRLHHDVTDGSSPSSFYPCACGSAVCEGTELCSTGSCAPLEALTVAWPCSFPGIGSGYFSLSGVSASGAPVYRNADGSYLYWDASCDGTGDHNGNQWIMDNEAPSTTALMHLDGDGDCVYLGHHDSSASHRVPLGNSTWAVLCDGNIADATVGVAYHAGPAPTPAPTLEPGAPCACGSPCGGFAYVDIDGDGCIGLAEAASVDGLGAGLVKMDTNGDGCVSQEECATSDKSYLIPSFTAPGTAECDYGFYVPEGASVCQMCPTGETRRRRSTHCTECPAGKLDLGDFDNCISGAYLLEPLEPGNTVLVTNTDVDESGALVMAGSVVQVATRNPGFYQRLTINDVISDTRNLSARLSAEERAELGSGAVTFNVSLTPSQYTFAMYDPVIKICSGTASTDFSEHYPCGCGSSICQFGERCDLSCHGAYPTSDVLAGSAYGQGGCCVGPAAAVLPTPAPTISATGDPHLVNLQGEHFDVNQVGEFTLLRIPEDAGSPAELELKATVLPEHGKPCTTYITEVEISGTWLGGKVVQVRTGRRPRASLAGSWACGW